jgi:hypothetical protein
VVDQFEELFTQIDADRRAAFIARLGEAADLPRLRILATLRADFFAQAVTEPRLADLLRRDRGTFPLEVPDARALEAMILGPARAAGLELEPGLTDRILADAGTEPGALPLMAFTLHALYETGKDDRRLTLAEYEAIGGVQGAMTRRAEATLSRLGREPGEVLGRVFEDLVEVNEQEVATRRRAVLAAVKARADDELLDALVEARLLVTGKGADDAPTVEVAHEALLTGWPRLTQWIEDHADALRARRDLERDANAWDAAGRPGAALRTASVLRRYRRALAPTPLAQVYLAACQRRETLGRLVLGATAALVLGVLGFFWWVERSGYPPALAAQGLLIRAGLMQVREPEMVMVPAGGLRSAYRYWLTATPAPPGPAALRYVDDMALCADDKGQLADWREAIRERLAAERLTLHPHKAHIYLTRQGLNLLGYLVFPDFRLLRNDNGHRFRRRLAGFARAYAAGRLDWPDFDPSVQAWIGHAAHADTRGLRESLFAGVGFTRASEEASHATTASDLGNWGLRDVLRGCRAGSVREEGLTQRRNDAT